MNAKELIAQIQRNKQAFTIYNRFKTQHSMQAFNEAQKHAFRIVPHLLHGTGPASFGIVDDTETPCGIFDFKWDSDIKPLLKKYFPKDRIEKPARKDSPPIEFLSLMGSVGSIAYTDKSDFDYWCCVKEGLSEKQIELLQMKFTTIEKWCEEILDVEVHFFMTTAKAIANNDFGEVSKESCGTALGKLLKEEYYRGSLLVGGKIPYWWIVPPGVNDSEYKSLITFVEKSSDFLENDFIDIGNIINIPMNEMIGGGLWQINKGFDSPFKSAIKLALLISYSAPDSEKQLLATKLKQQVQTNPNRMEFLDPYQLMIDDVLSHFEEDKKTLTVDLLRKCFFLKVAPSVTRWWNSPNDPDKNVDKVMLEYCKNWEWPEEQADKWEHFFDFPLQEIIVFKRDIEFFMLDQIRKLQKRCEEHTQAQSISEDDFIKMTLRMKSIYGNDRMREERYYKPFNKFVASKNYTLRYFADKDDGEHWELYKGIHSLKNEFGALEEKSFIKADSELSFLIHWMLNNNLITDDFRIHADLPDEDRFARNLRELSSLCKDVFGRNKVLDLDGDYFTQLPKPANYILCVNMMPGTDLGILNPDSKEAAFQSTFISQSNSKNLTENESMLSADNDMHYDASTGEDTNVHTATVILDQILGPRKTPKASGDLTPSPSDQETKRFSNLPGDKAQFANIDKDQRNILSTEDDPFNAWKLQSSLLSEAMLLRRNTWGETHFESYSGMDWLVHALAQTFNECLAAGVNPADSLETYIGRWHYDLSNLKPRLNNLLNDIKKHFFENENSDKASTDKSQRLSYYLFNMWGHPQILMRANQTFRGQIFVSLTKSLGSVAIQHCDLMTPLFDERSPYGRSYNTIISMSEPGKVQVYFYESHQNVSILTVDECQNIFPINVKKDRLRSFLPRFMHSLDLCMNGARLNAPDRFDKNHEKPSLSWITWKDGKVEQVKDFTEQTIKITSLAMKRFAETGFKIPDKTCDAFMKNYLSENRYDFEDETTSKLLIQLVKRIRELRSGNTKPGAYAIFLTRLVVDKSDNTHFQHTTTSWLYLKMALEEAMSLEMAQKTEAHPDGGFRRKDA